MSALAPTRPGFHAARLLSASNALRPSRMLLVIVVATWAGR